MASIRRTLSPVPRPGALMNGEACQVASPLSKTSSNSQNYPQSSSLLSFSMSSLEHALYTAQSFIFGIFSHRSSRPFDRSRIKGHFWRRAFLHFLMCFTIGLFIGLTPFASPNSIMSKQQDFDFELLQPAGKDEVYSVYDNETSVRRYSLNENSTSEPHRLDVQLNDALPNISYSLDSNVLFDKLMIIVTPTVAWPLQSYHLTRLSLTLKLVPHPLLWIVVEMNSQSVETAELLRNTGVMYRHLVCSIKNSTGADKSALLRNEALSHIEKHRLDGIVYFADDDKIYSSELFDKIRQISRFGVWPVAKLVESKGETSLQGPICNGSQVLGWHMDELPRRFRRFHADMSGFAFNSTIVWDQKRWHRPTLEPIRQLVTLNEGFQASTFIEQVVEDESQMECFSMDSAGIMVWHDIADLQSYPSNWFTSNHASNFIPLE